jgi:competence protein ComEC
VAERLAIGIGAGLPQESAALMLAMSIGRRDDLGELRDSFGAAGMAHLLALSGLHVGVLLVFFGKALGRLPRARLPVIALGTVAFVALVGPSPSVVRAATMALAALASTALGAGRAGPMATLSLAMLVGVLTAPQMVFDLGFQLSYLAVGGMLLYLPPWTERLATLFGPAPAGLDRWRRLVRGAGSAAITGALVSVAAQLPTLSLVAGTFLSVPVASPLVKVLAVPIAGLLVPLGFLAGLVGLVAEPLARIINLAVMPLAAALVWLAEVGARLPRLAWGEVTTVGHVAWALFAVTLAAWSRRRLRLAQVLAIGLVIGGATYALPARYSQPDIWFLDVGQGDSALLRVGSGANVLIDGGGSPFSDYDVGARVVVPALRALGVTHLSVVINTHADADHSEGLIAVLEAFPVGLLITGPPQPGNALDERLRALAAARGVSTHEARRGERLVVGDAVLEFVNPPALTSNLSGNDASVAFVLRHAGEARALFLGDLGVAVEPDLPVPPLDVLMVGHHGSRGSTSPGLVRAVSPRLAVISVGRNNYGHPVPEVVERLAENGAQVLTTREHGAVRVVLGSPTSWKAMASGEGGAATPTPYRGGAGNARESNQ